MASEDIELEQIHVAEVMQLLDGSQKRGSATLADLLRSQTAYLDYFEDIEKHPEIDPRQRFQRLRAHRAGFVETLVWRVSHQLEDLLQDSKNGKVDPDDEATKLRYVKINLDLDKTLSWYSRVNKEDSDAANAPGVTPFWMDRGIRYFLSVLGKGVKAPNAELSAKYGSIGDPVPSTLLTLRGSDNNPIRDLILKYLLDPFDQVLEVSWRLWNKILGRNLPPRERGMKGRTVNLVVNIIECLIAVGCLATTIYIVTLYHSIRARLLVGTVFSLIIIVPAVAFLSQAASRTLALACGIWAVLAAIIFFSDAKYD